MDCRGLKDAWKAGLAALADPAAVKEGERLAAGGAVIRLAVMPGRVEATVSFATVYRVVMAVMPWSLTERHRVLVAQRGAGVLPWCEWIRAAGLLRIPFAYGQAPDGACSCGKSPVCVHRLAAAFLLAERASTDGIWIFRLLNRGDEADVGLAEAFYRQLRISPELGQGGERTHHELVKIAEEIRRAVERERDRGPDPAGGGR